MLTSTELAALREQLSGVVEIECVTADLNGIPRGKVMTVEGFLSGRRLQLARGVMLQCVMGGYPAARFYGSDDDDFGVHAPVMVAGYIGNALAHTFRESDYKFVSRAAGIGCLFHRAHTLNRLAG